MLIQNILQRKKTFSNVEQIIAEYILKQQEKLENQNARYIATQLFISPSAITRLCQKIGFEGFNDFKKEYLAEVAYLSSCFNDIDPNYPFSQEDKNIIVTNKIAKLYHETIDDNLTIMNHNTIQIVVNILNKVKTICIVSLGVQIDLANIFKDKMLKINKNVIIENKMDEAFSRANFTEKDSVFIVISYSGETESLLRVVKKLKERKILIIAITTYGDNSLVRLADYVLNVSTREKLIHNLGNFSFNISVLFLFDVLYANLFNNNYYQNLKNKIEVSKDFEKYRNSNNPILNDDNN